jgi:hypothetical protein
MALAVGEDLPQADSAELQSHMAECEDCQKSWDNHQRGFAVLQSSRSEQTIVIAPRSTVWPVVAGQIQRRALTPRRVELNGWIASLVVVSASILVFVFSLDEPEFTRPSGKRRIVISGTPVIHTIDPATNDIPGRVGSSNLRPSSRPNSGEL